MSVAMCRGAIAVACAMAPALASANGRPPVTNGVHFKPGDHEAAYVATTFGLLVSPDGCRFYWLCEDDIGFGGEFDPAYAVTGSGTIVATTFHGLRVSRDGGCSFATAKVSGENSVDLSNSYFDAIDVSPTGEVCVGSSDTAADNGVFCSIDDAVTFGMRGVLPPTMWYRSITFAPGDASRLYTSAYQVGGPDADGGERPPTAHLFRSDDDGMHWIEEPLAGIVYGSVPQIYVMAVSPTNEDVVFMRSQGANPPVGDRLLRSTDGGVTFVEVLATSDAITDVVVHDASTVFVATAPGSSFRSNDGGATFQPLAMQLTCLGQRSDGALFGCAPSYGSGRVALARSSDGDTWSPVLRLPYITGALHCPVGTAEHDTCDGQLWPALATQLGVTPAACATGPDVDGPRTDTTAPGHHSGCCDAGESSGAPAWIGVLTLAWLAVPRRRSARHRRMACQGEMPRVRDTAHRYRARTAGRRWMHAAAHAERALPS